jgi:hypothetical protein
MIALDQWESCKTVKDMIDVIGHTPNNIPLSKLTPFAFEQLSKIFDAYDRKIPSLEDIAKPEIFETPILKGLNMFIVPGDGVKGLTGLQVMELMSVSDYLGAAELIQLCAMWIAMFLKNATREQVQAYFEIVETRTEEQIAADIKDYLHNDPAAVAENCLLGDDAEEEPSVLDDEDDIKELKADNDAHANDDHDDDQDDDDV